MSRNKPSIRPPVVGVHMDMVGHFVEISTEDGRMLQATAVLPEGATKAVILLHMAGGSRNDYRRLQEKLHEMRIASIAINFRGNFLSGSTEDKKLYLKQYYPHYQTFDKDAEAARNFLIKKGFRDSCIGVVGGSVGSSIALKYAAANSEIPVIVLLSPGLRYFGIDAKKYMREYGNRPALLMYATEATGEKHSVDTLKNLHPDPSRVHVEAIRGGFWGAHATLAFYIDSGLIDRIAAYLNRHIPACY